MVSCPGANNLKEDWDKTPTDYPKNTVSFGAQLWFCIPAAAAERKNLWILMLEATEGCWGDLTPRLWEYRDSPASDAEYPARETAGESWLLQGNALSLCKLEVIGSKAQVTS